jgi:hypothetical protein
MALIVFPVGVLLVGVGAGAGADGVGVGAGLLGVAAAGVGADALEAAITAEVGEEAVPPHPAITMGRRQSTAILRIDEEGNCIHQS